MRSLYSILPSDVVWKTSSTSSGTKHYEELPYRIFKRRIASLTWCSDGWKLVPFSTLHGHHIPSSLSRDIYSTTILLQLIEYLQTRRIFRQLEKMLGKYMKIFSSWLTCMTFTNNFSAVHSSISCPCTTLLSMKFVHSIFVLAQLFISPASTLPIFWETAVIALMLPNSLSPLARWGSITSLASHLVANNMRRIVESSPVVS